MRSDSCTRRRTSSCVEGENGLVDWSGKGLKSEGGEAYVGQVFDNVEKELGLLVFVVHLLNGLAADEVLGDLRPGLGAARRGRGAADRDAAVCHLLDLDLAVSAAAVLVDDLHAEAPLALGRGAQLRDARRRRHDR